MAVKISGLDNSTSSSAASDPQKDVLESSAKMVDYHMQLDGSYSELADCLKMGGDFPNVSGLNDQDYPGVSELGISLQVLSQLNVVKKTPLPPELVEQFGLMQTNCQMGLFPEIGRAWLSIDSNVFLWSFHDGSDLAYFDGITDTILCVGLVKPKPGIFQSFIHYLLCLATPVEIVLLGVSFSRQNEDSPLFEEMHLLPEPLFSYPTDNTIMSCFAGTENGRIFLGGRDGCIYEFTYQAASSWFSRKCRKINHSSSPFSFFVPTFIQVAFCEDDAVSQIAIDDSRNIMYVRSEKGSIQVFDLGEDGNQMSKVTSLHHQTILNNASNIAKTVDSKNFAPIVSISAVEANESRCVNLIAITQAGVRLYFTTNVDCNRSRPFTLVLLHVRLPPGFSANSTMDRPANVHMALYKKGFFLLAASLVEDHDVLFATCNDSFVFHPNLIETHTAVTLDGRTWSMSEVPVNLTMKLEQKQQKDSFVVDPPLLLTEHEDLQRHFVLLSAQGCSLFTKPRPVDLLRKLLVTNQGPDCDAVKAFFKLHREAQSCAMALILSCSQNPQAKQVSDWATRAFFLYGGSPSVTSITPTIGDIGNPADSLLNHSMSLQPTVWASTPAQQEQSGPLPVPPFANVCSPVKSVLTASTMHNPAITPQVQQTSSTISSSASMEVVYSGKHNGLYLYFSRIMRSVWSLRLVTEKTVAFQGSTPLFQLCSSISIEQIASLLSYLSALRDFITRYYSLIANIGNTGFMAGHLTRFPGIPVQTPLQDKSITRPQLHKDLQSDADIQERTSLMNLKLLVNYTYELLGLWKVLCDHQFENVIHFLSPENLDQLKHVTFRDFIIDGKELCCALASSLINFYLEDNASTTAISTRLREVCPSVYRVEDATVSRAHEIIRNAKNIVNEVDREKALMEALKMSKSVCPNFNLEDICHLFNETHFYYGVVDLCLCMAQKLDPQGLALHYYNNCEPPNDQQGLQAFASRMNCYKTVISTIDSLTMMSESHPQSPNIPKSPGLQEARKPAPLTPEQAKSYFEQIFEMALKTRDELFHAALYDWLIEKNHTDTLLSIKSHFLENYLKRRTTIQPESMQSLDMLWKFYEKNQNFSAAARVLNKLSDKQGCDLTLSKRMEYLSRAIICVKSSEMRVSTGGEGEFLHELEEKMEVARIQVQILETLQRMKVPNTHDSITRLNSSFLNITQLFEEFAHPYDLPESKLAIVHCAGHYDTGLIESLWSSIIDKELVSTCGNIAETRVKILQQKFQSISQTYISSEKYFPIIFIIKYLEYKSCELNLEPNWVFNTMMTLGFTLSELLAIYNKLYRSKDPCWHAIKQPLHLLKVLSLLIGVFVNTPTHVPQKERRSFVTHCLDIIAGYLVDLQSMNTMDTAVSTLEREFKSIQHKLDRLL